MYIIVEGSGLPEIDNCEWKVTEETGNRFVINAWEKEYIVDKRDCVGYPVLTKETGVHEIDKHLGDRIEVRFDKYRCYTPKGIEVPRESLEFSEEND